jgi:hypothetical protein
LPIPNTKQKSEAFVVKGFRFLCCGSNGLRTGELSVKTAKSRTKVFGTGQLSVKTADSRTTYTCREQKRPKTWLGKGQSRPRTSVRSHRLFPIGMEITLPRQSLCDN